MGAHRRLMPAASAGVSCPSVVAELLTPVPRSATCAVALQWAMGVELMCWHWMNLPLEALRLMSSCLELLVMLLLVLAILLASRSPFGGVSRLTVPDSNASELGIPCIVGRFRVAQPCTWSPLEREGMSLVASRTPALDARIVVEQTFGPSTASGRSTGSE
eukprot:6491218-Amphidinium_carterae.2